METFGELGPNLGLVAPAQFGTLLAKGDPKLSRFIYFMISILCMYLFVFSCVYLSPLSICASKGLPEFFPRFRLDVTFRGSRFGDDYAESGCLGDHCH